ncbi:MAG: hypothetical protein WA947_14640 [Phormidesmis sp.]
MPLSVFLNVAIAITDTLGKIHAAHVSDVDLMSTQPWVWNDIATYPTFY